MKKLFFGLIFIFICSLFVGCSFNKSNQDKDISMIIKDGTLTKSGATLIITDVSGNNNTYGEWFRIDKKEKGKWKELDTKIDNFAFNMIGYLVDQDNKLELEHNWEWLYGRLGTGEYRIVKEVNNQYIYAFFKI